MKDQKRPVILNAADATSLAFAPGVTKLVVVRRFEFPETIMVFLAGAVHFICSKKKGEILGAPPACQQSVLVLMLLYGILLYAALLSPQVA